MVAMLHFFSASADWLHASIVRFVCTECGEHSERPVEDIVARHGADCTLGQVVAGATCRRCGSPFIAATPGDDDDEEDADD
jgi:hypothetical protein